MKTRVLVLDFGSQYNQLIIRRIRALGYYAELRSGTISKDEIKSFGPSMIILSGGPASVYDEGSPKPAPELFELGFPVLGICYGMQVMVHQLGGEIASSSKREYGKAELEKSEGDSPLLKGIDTQGRQVWMSHGDSVKSLPEGFVRLTSTESTPYAIIENSEKKLYGLQFHPEVNHTLDGEKIIENFIKHICQAEADWQMKNYIDSSLEKIRETVGEDGEVILGLSGGVDSSVMAVLLDQALGDRLTCIFIDNGLLRLNEGDQVESFFKEHYHFKLVRVDAEKDFLDALEGLEDPEQKRKAIGRVFVETFEKQLVHYPKATFLAQGTIYPDVIESTSTHGKSETIKSHHNVGGLPEKMKLKILEPLRELFKDEVRSLGRELGLPEKMVNRHPFPGPGLGVRILGEVTRDKCETLRQADAIYLEEIEKNGLYGEIAQAFAVLLPVKSVGVMGDGRTYENVLALRAVTSMDFMTAEWYAFPPKLLSLISGRIIGEVKGINRVVYDITSKPPGTIEWE